VNKPLAGRRALVTGASRGIGAEIVRRLAADGATVAFTYGASVAAADALLAEVARDGGSALPIRADAADPGQVSAAVHETVTRFGGLEILVNNAGIAAGGDVETFPLETFDRMVAVNIRGMFVAIQHAIPHLPTGGRIINIGSINADRVPNPGLAVYAMTKSAVAGLTRGLARDLGPRGITVNNVQPGPVDTDMNPKDGPLSESARPLLAVGHYGTPGDVAGVVAYLAGPDSSYVTGAHWNVDGGFTV
jgi:3-oxoacyl-[acyl-carrier protein] reductase